MDIGGLSGNNYRMARHIKTSIKNMTSMTLTKTDAPIPEKDGNIDTINMPIFQERINLYVKQQDIIDDGIKKSQ